MDQSSRVSKTPWIILGLLVALCATGFIVMASFAKTSYAGGTYKGSPAQDSYMSGDGFQVTFAGFDGKVEMIHVIDFSPIYEEMEQSRGSSGGGGPIPDTMNYLIQNQTTFQKGQWQRSYGSKILFTEDGPIVTFNGLPARQIGLINHRIPLYVSGVDSDGLVALGKRLPEGLMSELAIHCTRFENYHKEISENGMRPRGEDRPQLPSRYEKARERRRRDAHHKAQHQKAYEAANRRERERAKAKAAKKAKKAKAKAAK